MSGSRPVRTPAGVVNVEPVAGAARGTGDGPARRDVEDPVRRAGVMRFRSFDTWSVMRTAFVLSIAIAIVILVAVLALWALFTVTGVFSSVSRVIDDVAGSSYHAKAWFSLPRVLLVTILVGLVEVVLTTAAITLLASLYNAAASWTGGVEVVVSEDR